MQRIPFVIAVLAVVVVVASLCKTPSGNCDAAEQPGSSAEIGLNRSLHAPWDDGPAFAMQWNDTCKKLLFDGFPVCHAKPVVHYGYSGGGRVGFVDPAPLISSTPAASHPDEYSFDVGDVGSLAISAAASKHDGQTRYGMEWSDVENKFEFRMSLSPDAVRDPNLFIPIVWLAD